MAEVRNMTDPVSSPTNGLTTDVLRARAVEYYNNYLPQTPRSQSNNPQHHLIHKSGSITHLNAVGSNTKMAPNHALPTSSSANNRGAHVYKERPHRNNLGIGSGSGGGVIHYSSHPRGDRAHRTHSERSNRLFHPPISTGINNHHANKVLSSTGTNNTTNCGNNTTKLGLYRSNSSLDLEHDDIPDDRLGALKREYGSASSLDVISTTTTGDSFFAMLREFHSDNPDQRSPGPAKIQDYLRGRVDPAPSTQNASNALTNGTTEGLEDSQSPKLKNKFHKLWEMKDKSTKVRSKVLGGSHSGGGHSSEPNSIFRKFRSNKSDSANITTSINVESSHRGSDNSLDAESRLEEKLRKKAFAHYDCQSLTTNLNYASRLCHLLRKRRNTTTGASAASVLSRTPSGSTENLDPEETDLGDGRSNDLLLSCPFFRNELGGEDERLISLNKLTCKKQKFHRASDLDGVKGGGCGGGGVLGPPTVYRPLMACGLSVLENANANRWKHRSCPYQRPAVSIENVDAGALYYRQHFYTQDHQNWFGVDENFGPLAVSVKREKVDEPTGGGTSSTTGGSTNNSSSLYRVIIRTSELSVMRGSVLEESIPALSRSSSPRSTHAKEVLDYVAPELLLSCLRLAHPGPPTEEQLLKLDEQGLTNTYKVGIMYCKAGQATEEDMYNNEHSGPAFEEFLEMLGKRIRLKGFDKYRAGLDNKTDTCGLYSIYSTYHDNEVMFHVSTMLPYTPNNRQQLLRKRHIGNDIVTIVFQEPDALPFTPKSIRSHFQHVFIVVRALNPCTDTTRYSVAISRSKEVPVFGPSIPEGATFTKSKAFADFILAKVINAENAAHYSEKFATMAQRTRQEYLKDLAANHASTTTIDSGPKFSILSFGGRKKERPRLRFIPDSYVQGAISWQLQVEDFGQSTVLDCTLGISVDTFVLIEESTKEIAFVCPCSAIIGWSSNTSSLKIFYHQGECLVLHTKDPDVDEVQEIVSRLSHVTRGCETIELILRRNSLGQLGFHVQYEGVVTEVEGYGFAWQAGLRQGSRLVEICKVAASTLSYDQMVDLLKTSMTVTVTVIPPFPDGGPRKGCTLQNCSYLSSSSSTGDYENVGGSSRGDDDGGGGKKSGRSTNSASGQKQSHRTNGSVRMLVSRHENASSTGVGGVPGGGGVHSLPSSHGNTKGEQKYNNSNEKHNNHYILDPSKDPHYHSHSNNSTNNRDLPSPPPVPNSFPINNRIGIGSSNSPNNLPTFTQVTSTPSATRSTKHQQQQQHQQPQQQSRSSPPTPYAHLTSPPLALAPTSAPPPLHHNHAHHRSFHDHHSAILSRRLKPAVVTNGQLTHFGGMVASRSELSLNELIPSSGGPHLNNGRLHSHHNIIVGGGGPTATTRSPPDYNYASRSISNGMNGKTSGPHWSPLLIREPKELEQQPKSLPSVAASTYSDYYSDSSNEWHQGANSADELSGGSSHRSTPPRSNNTSSNHHHHNHTIINQPFIRPEMKPSNNDYINNHSPSATPITRTTPRPDSRPNQLIITSSSSSNKLSSSGGISSSVSGGGRLRASTFPSNNLSSGGGTGHGGGGGHRVNAKPHHHHHGPGHYGTGTSSSSSCSGSSSSTLQEDLLKLISPDFLDNENGGDVGISVPGLGPAGPGRLSSSQAELAPSEAGSSSSTQTQPSTPYSSLERSERSGSRGSDLSSTASSNSRAAPLPLSSSSSQHLGGNNSASCTPVMDHPGQSNDDVILTKAQPAQVISSEPNSPSPIDTPMTREERLSPRVTSDRLLNKLKPLPPPPPPPTSQSLSVPLSVPSSINSMSPNFAQTTSIFQDSNGDIDWPAIVDKATKALAIGLPISKPWLDELCHQIELESNKTNGPPSQHVHDLQSKVWKLKQDLAKEQHQKANLEHEIHQLRQENQRLQEESQSASAQLRKFTQWFLHTMDS